MSTVNPFISSAQGQQQSGAAAEGAATESSKQFGEEFTSFIQLLTAQVQNQDPLSPLDSTQFVEQLASFSTLEQQVRSNDSLGSIATMIGDLHAMFASEWLGQKVSVESSWVPYSGDTVEYSVEAPADADRAVLTIQDDAGNPVWTETLDMKAASFAWDGQTQAGEKAAPDTLFNFGIDMYRGSDYLGTVAPQVLTTVTDVANEDGTLRLGTSSHLTTDLAGARKVPQ